MTLPRSRLIDMPRTPPDPETIRRAVDEIFSSGEYDLAPRPKRSDAVAEFFAPFRERIWEPLVEWWDRLAGRWPWIDEVLAVILAAMLLVLIVQVIRHRRAARDRPIPRPAADELAPPEELHRRALELAESNDFVGAARLLLVASILRLEQAEQRINRPGTTNRELLRRYRGTTLAAPLTTLVETIDRGWFGGRSCSRLDYLECLDAHDAIASATRPRIRGAREMIAAGAET